MSDQAPGRRGTRTGRPRGPRLPGAREGLRGRAPRRQRPRPARSRCATPRAHVMAEAVMDLFPGTKLGIGPAIKDGFYYDFDLPRPLMPEDLAAIEARMRESIAADHPFVRTEWDPDEGRAFLEQQGQPYKVEILDDLRTAAPAVGLARADRVHLPARPLHRPLPRPARRVHRQDRAVQAALGRGCLLARPRGPADAAAHLRHGLGHPGGARPLPVAARGGAQARPPPPRRRARPVQLPRRQPRLGLLAPQGPEAVAHPGGRHARAPGAARLPGGEHAHPGPQEAVGAVGPLGPLRRQHVPAWSPRARPSASSP